PGGGGALLLRGFSPGLGRRPGQVRKAGALQAAVLWLHLQRAGPLPPACCGAGRDAPGAQAAAKTLTPDAAGSIAGNKPAHYLKIKVFTVSQSGEPLLSGIQFN